MDQQINDRDEICDEARSTRQPKRPVSETLTKLASEIIESCPTRPGAWTEMVRARLDADPGLWRRVEDELVTTALHEARAERPTSAEPART